MKYEPGDEVYYTGGHCSGRWRVATVGASGNPALCTRIDDNYEPVAFKQRNGLWVIDQQNLAPNNIADFELCVVRDMREALRLAKEEREAEERP